MSLRFQRHGLAAVAGRAPPGAGDERDGPWQVLWSLWTQHRGRQADGRREGKEVAVTQVEVRSGRGSITKRTQRDPWLVLAFDRPVSRGSAEPHRKHAVNDSVV